MICPRCAHSTTASNGRCPACGAVFAESTVVTLDDPVDTTWLPPGTTVALPTSPNVGTTTMGPTVGADATVHQSVGGTAPSHDIVAGGALRVGQSFGPRYHIIKVLGVGGMGAVYQAWDAELNVGVALKVIRTDATHRSASAEAQKRFKLELLLARQVTHKNVVRIHDLGEIDGTKYITMPYVQGDDLGTVLRRDGKVPVARALRLARQMASGLQAAHEAGVVHRDLK